jgi:hypothetical protein
MALSLRFEWCWVVHRGLDFMVVWNEVVFEV